MTLKLGAGCGPSAETQLSGDWGLKKAQVMPGVITAVPSGVTIVVGFESTQSICWMVWEKKVEMPS